MNLFYSERLGYITDFILDMREHISSFSYVLITCVDSSTGEDLHQLFRRFAAGRKESLDCTFIRDGVVVSGVNFLCFCDEESLFFGFDAVWFFREMPPFAPEDLYLTSERAITDIDDRERGRLSRYLAESGCCFALGDGVGVNIVSRDDKVSSWVLSQYQGLIAA